jgi:transposase
MRKIRDILRSHFDGRLSPRQTALALKVSRGAVLRCLDRFRKSGMPYPLPAGLGDMELEARLYPASAVSPLSRKPQLTKEDCADIHRELSKTGVTLQLLWEDYLAQTPQGLGYSWYCEQYSRYKKSLGLSFRNTYKGGEMSFLDYSGKKRDIVDRQTGEVRQVELFVWCWGASNFTYWEFSESQKTLDFLGSQDRALACFGCVPRVSVPDNLKSGVTTPCRYEPELNLSYDRFAEHYGTTILPARVRTPKDKAKVEGAVRLAQRWLLGRLRNRVFFSLAELNAAAHELLLAFNAKVMKGYGQSRRELFEEIDKPNALPLPDFPYEMGIWKRPVRLGIDYHLEVDSNFYSAPYTLRGRILAVKISEQLVEVFLGVDRVASHRRLVGKRRYSTQTNHMPVSHQQYVEWNSERIVAWAEKIGPSAHALAEAMLHSRRHPSQAYRSILGITRLEKNYGKERLESACALALRYNLLSYKAVADILKNGREKGPTGEKAPSRRTASPHENIRGAVYYQGRPNEGDRNDIDSDGGKDESHEAPAYGRESWTAALEAGTGGAVP